MQSPKKPQTKFHEAATFAFMGGIVFGIFWMVDMWPVYNSGGPTAMLAQGLANWHLYATWACLGISFGLYLIGEKRL